MDDNTMILALFAGIGELFLTLTLENQRKINIGFFAQSGPWPKKSPPKKVEVLRKIFYNFVFLISSRAQTGAVHTNSTRRIFLNRSQGFLTSFLGVKADWKSYFENYKKKGARSSAPDRWILCKIGRGIVWEGSRTPEIAKRMWKWGKYLEIQKS